MVERQDVFYGVAIYSAAASLRCVELIEVKTVLRRSYIRDGFVFKDDQTRRADLAINARPVKRQTLCYGLNGLFATVLYERLADIICEDCNGVIRDFRNRTDGLFITERSPNDPIKIQHKDDTE